MKAPVGSEREGSRNGSDDKRVISIQFIQWTVWKRRHRLAIKNIVICIGNVNSIT